MAGGDDSLAMLQLPFHELRFPYEISKLRSRQPRRSFTSDEASRRYDATADQRLLSAVQNFIRVLGGCRDAIDEVVAAQPTMLAPQHTNADDAAAQTDEDSGYGGGDEGGNSSSASSNSEHTSDSGYDSHPSRMV
ncbi:hypothetical protein LTR37_021123 [Vermiconidia calcicola]|uniref:Uncharacterized protein n=1 Tax=Vermiconidia calcicola TaxID=1690605 RepID=A0ACC3M9H4_9PEZI|nr:hypothetical protein LTR37_021123 [Vermiconidia calcicola]